MPLLAGAAESVASSARVSDPLSLESVSQMLLGLLLVVALIFLLAWVFRRANFIPGQGVDMRVIASLPLGARERAVLVQCGEKQLLLGVSSGSVQLLAQFDEPVIAPDKAGSSDFANKLAQLLQARRGD
ncbi:MAG: flagellar biosynthetic protein FliO [Oceanospirillaceae bacterium]|nr:flagellar biosynthetic protein FliO [Oceanospirillaceae bacterium]